MGSCLRWSSRSRRSVGKQPFAQDGMDAPIAVDHLRDAEIHRRRDQRDRLVLAQSLGVHQEPAHLAERVLHREIERGFGVDFALPLGAEFGEIIRMAEAGQHPVGFGFDQRIGQIGERPAGMIGLLVQHDLEGAGHRTFDRGAREFAVALRGVRIADREQAPPAPKPADRPRRPCRAANCRGCRRNRPAAPESTRPVSRGATPITPKCGRSGIRDAFEYAVPAPDRPAATGMPG